MKDLFPTDAMQVLNNAREAMERADYMEALKGFEWFHLNALQCDPALKGVRLSFALRDWLELATHYPAAMDLYQKTICKYAQNLIRGTGDMQAFVDLAAMNERAGQGQMTYEVFKQLRIAQPSLSDACMPWALPSVLAAQDYELAKTIYGDAEMVIEEILSEMSDQLRAASTLIWSSAHVEEACVRVAAQDLKLVLDTFHATEGEEKLALLQSRVRHLARHTNYADLLLSKIWQG